MLWAPALGLAVATCGWPKAWSGQWWISETGRLEQVAGELQWQLQQPALLTPWLLVVRVGGSARRGWLWCWRDQLSHANWSRMRRISLNLTPVSGGSKSSPGPGPGQ